MRITWKEFAYYNYLIGIALMVIALPIFNLGMSIASFYIAGVWVVDLFHDFVWKKTPWVKFRSLSKDYVALSCIGLYLAFGVGMIYSSNIEYALHDLKIKAPLLIIPLGLSMLAKVRSSDFRKIINLFILSTTFSVSCAMAVRFQLVDIAFNDVREITRLFIARISHVRLSLMVVLAGTLAIWQIVSFRQRISNWSNIILAAVVVYFISFLIVLKSGTGIAIWSVVILIYALFATSSGPITKYVRIGAIALVGALGCYTCYCAYTYFDVHEEERLNLESHSANGELYEHNLDLDQVENGHYVWIYYAPKEMGTSWNLRSEVNVDSTDARGQHLRATLIRYLTSRGLRKDASGVNALSEDDITRIEKGYTSVEEGRKFPLRQRIDDILFEYDSYLNGGNPSGNSLTQRLEYWNTACYIIGQNPWFGVGTGDVQDSFDIAYEERNTLLKKPFRLRAHNQYLTTALTLGIPLAVLFSFLLILVWKKAVLTKHIPAIVFLTIVALSFITEDTLETQAGVTFFALFISFVHRFDRDNQIDVI